MLARPHVERALSRLPGEQLSGSSFGGAAGNRARVGCGGEATGRVERKVGGGTPLANPKILRKPGGLKAFLTAVVLTTLAAVPVLAADTLTPPTVTMTLEAGQSTTVDKTFHLDALPGAADIVFGIDTTGSMGGAIADAKADAANIVNQVQAQIPGAR